jgi:hypothetical protein
MRDRVILVGLLLTTALGWPGTLDADVIHLANGSQLTVEAWREAGDAIEFLSGGGIVQIPKSEVRKIDGKPSRGFFQMRSSGPEAAGAAATGAELDRAAAVKQMGELLREADTLFTQTALTSTEKASGFRRLSERWRGFDVPEPLRAAHTRGQQAIQLALDAFTTDSLNPGTADPTVRSRLERARTEIQGAQEDVKKLEQAS